MPKSLGKFLNDHAAKAGIANDNPKLLALLQNKDLATIELDDEILTALESNLHSLDSAEAKLKSKLWAQAYNGIDTEIERQMTEVGLDDVTKATLLAEKSTPKRVISLITKIREIESAKAKAAPGDKDKLTTQINELNQKLADSVNTNKKALTDQQSVYEQQITDLMYDNHLASYKLVVPNGFTKEDTLTIARGKLKTAMESGELRISRQNGQLKLVTKDGTEYFDNTNQKKDLKSFTESLLAQHNLLQTTDTGNTGGGNTSHQPAIIPGARQPDPSHVQLMNTLDEKIKEAQGAVE